jgi:uncharacterized membrane-anchored protein YhcB (DUF1043 family)
MTGEVQIALLAGSFGIIGTLLGGLMQGLLAERSARRQELEERETRFRTERREGYIGFITTTQLVTFDLVSEATRYFHKYGAVATLDSIDDAEFHSLEAKALTARSEVSRSTLATTLVATKSVEPILRKLANDVNQLSDVIRKDRPLQRIADWSGTIGNDYQEVLERMRIDLDYETDTSKE